MVIFISIASPQTHTVFMTREMILMVNWVGVNFTMHNIQIPEKLKNEKLPYKVIIQSLKPMSYPL